MIRLLPGDCREVLATLPADSVHCVVTSPPYFGLRDYQTARWDGGDAACDHRHGPLVSPKSTLRLDGRDHLGPYAGEKAVVAGMPFRDACGKCGATRVDRQIGLEASPDLYLAEMVRVFREVKRVLRPDGTCWVNMGDSYVSSATGSLGNVDITAKRRAAGGTAVYQTGLGAIERPSKLGAGKPKDLLMMPARLALALQADGWWLRSDIIWHKPNPMPESVTDRPTSAHEHVFLLAKSARYFYDADAVREASEYGEDRATYIGGTARLRQSNVVSGGLIPSDKGMVRPEITSRSCRNVWTIATAPLSSAFSGGSYRIASRDCAAHDRQADLAHVLECDARRGVFQFGRNPGKRSRPAELPEGAVVSIPVDRSAFPAGVTSAIGHSSQTHRTPALSERDVIFADIPSGHTECRVLLDHSFAMSARTPASNTSPGASPDAPLSCQSVERSDRIVGIATYEPRPAGCSCYYAGTVHQRQDHFASFPPALAERCIRAGTSERGCCAACGAPWGRVVERVKRPRGDAFGVKDIGKYDHGQAGTPYMETVSSTTTGWAPSCACALLRCVSCLQVLETRNASTKHTMSNVRQAGGSTGKHATEEVLRLALLQGVDAAENREADRNKTMRDVRGDVQTLDETEQVLQPCLPWEPGEEAEADPVPAMRDGVHASQLSAETMLEAVRGPMGRDQSGINEGVDPDQHGLQADLEEGPPEREQIRLRPGTSAGDGEEAKPVPDIRRGGASQERRSARQQDQQPGTDGKAPTRRASKADVSCDVPALSGGVSDARQCPHCGSHAEWTTPDIIPATVLDCFAGAGTTLLVADRLQRDAIGIELNPAYTEMAMARCRDDAPLFAEPSPPPAEDPEDARMADLFAEPLAAD